MAIVLTSDGAAGEELLFESLDGLLLPPPLLLLVLLFVAMVKRFCRIKSDRSNKTAGEMNVENVHLLSASLNPPIQPAFHFNAIPLYATSYRYNNNMSRIPQVLTSRVVLSK
jgi:hypothetical protein